jgi:hypothetical protein
MADWSLAKTTGAEPELFFCPSELNLLLIELRVLISVVWLADVAAPVGRLIVPETLLIFHVPDCVAATVQLPPWLAVTVPLTGWVTLDPSTGTRPETKAGVLVSMLDRLELAVVWLAAVAAPVGRGRVAALMGWVKADPSTFKAPPVVLVSFPSMLDRLELPVVWSAEVEAPAGRGKLAALMGCVVVPVGSKRSGLAAVPASTLPPDAESLRLTP